MGERKVFLPLAVAVIIMCSWNNSGLYAQTVDKSKQVTTKSTSKTKATQQKKKTTVTGKKTTGTKTVKNEAKPATPAKDPDVVIIGQVKWGIANLNVSTFSNGDSIPEAKSNKDWVAAGEAGKPAWCYYNNDPVFGKRYGKLYNWFAVNDPRGLAPKGWKVASVEDWAKLTYVFGGIGKAGTKLKSDKGWTDGSNGDNESGFNGLPGGYRVENGLFMNVGNTGIWWSSSESRATSANDHYMALNNALNQSSSPKQRGESVRCIKEK